MTCIKCGKEHRDYHFRVLHVETLHIRDIKEKAGLYLKGLLDGVRLDMQYHFGWEMLCLPMEDLTGLQWSDRADGPRFLAELLRHYEGLTRNGVEGVTLANNHSLDYGEEAYDETKRILDIGAPGGGFIMDTSIVLDKCPRENLHAMFDTTLEYGKY